MRSPAELKALANRFFEYFNARNFEGLDKEVIGPEYVQYSPGVPPTRESIMGFIEQTMVAYPNGRFEVDDMIAEGDKVLIRWTFLGTHLGPFGASPPTGKDVTMTGMDLWRYGDDDKIAEAWFFMDMRPFFALSAAQYAKAAKQREKVNNGAPSYQS